MRYLHYQIKLAQVRSTRIHLHVPINNQSEQVSTSALAPLYLPQAPPNFLSFGVDEGRPQLQ